VAQEVLLKVLADWFVAGSLEYVERFHRLPHCILAIGAVPKASPPFRRLVTDCRPINIFAEKWRVKYAAVSDICLMLFWCAMLWIRDFRNAYHLVRLGGCRGRTKRLVRWITNDAGTGYVPADTFQSGCGPGSCLGLCDKSMFGICVCGHVSRFAVAQFGHAVSHGPLFVITEAVIAMASRKFGVDIASFVDDLLNALFVALHAACKGLKGNCRICMEAFDRATVKMEQLDHILKACGLAFSDKGDLTISQEHIFIGIIFDVLNGRLLITVEKFGKTMALLLEVMQQAELSPRGMAKLRGKFGHQFRCIEGVAPLLVPFNKFIGGPESVREWDEPKIISPALRTIMGELYQWLPRLQPAGAAMWPLDPSTILFRWQRWLSVPGGPLVVAYWHASPFAVGISGRTRPDEIWRSQGMRYEQASTIVTFDSPLEAQVHRESAGAPMVLDFLRAQMDLRGWQILFVNDCMPVVIAMRKGSHSMRLQADAERVTLGLLEAGAKASFLHIPGTEMVAAGTDGASREGAKNILGPSCTPAGREKILAFLAVHGWRATIDLFAADCNKFTERYASWTDEPNSEAVDAFAMDSWNQSICPCGRAHRETPFIFPPKRLERAVFKRARSDGVRAIFVVPTAHTAAYWKGLRARSEAQLEMTSPRSEFHNPQGTMGNHTVFLVDFGAADSPSPATCGQDRLRRGRRHRLGAVELEERSRTRAERAKFDRPIEDEQDPSQPCERSSA